MSISIKRFSKDKSDQWDNFLAITKNEVFLFNRAYMEYHEDRFTDHSLILYKYEKIIALFPANQKDNTIQSHGGLTFGGVIYTIDTRAHEMVLILDAIKNYYRNEGVKSIYYKAIPYIFSKYPAQEDLYALTQNDAYLYRRDISSAIKLSVPIKFSETKRQLISKCEKAGMRVTENRNFTDYWGLLETVLEKFGVKPVHTLAEISSLSEKFPGNIRLYEAKMDNVLLAGIVIYDYGQVVHTQYMANSHEGRKMGALDFINAYCITDIYKDREYYSFGISTEQEGKVLNEGLIQQKEMMGGRGIVNDFYKIDL